MPELASRIAGDRTEEEAPLDAAMWAAVAMLPERQRTAVALFYIGDRSISDVAEAMDVGEGEVVIERDTLPAYADKHGPPSGVWAHEALRIAAGQGATGFWTGIGPG